MGAARFENFKAERNEGYQRYIVCYKHACRKRQEYEDSKDKPRVRGFAYKNTRKIREDVSVLEKLNDRHEAEEKRQGIPVHILSVGRIRRH